MATNALGTFLTKFQDWKFCPPSDHLWTVSIVLHPRGDKNSTNNFGALFNNICQVNSKFDSMFSPKWKLTVNGEENTYFGSLQDSKIGLFLATDISFNANSVNITDSQSGLNQQFTGFLSFGKTQTGRNHNHAIKIKFLKSNWDINDLFIDRWIAAIGQQGLIEDESLPNIKGNIIITEYACGIPGKNDGTWFARKQIILTKAFPKSRDQIEYSYSSDSAGEFKSKGVDFEFDAYQVTYFAPGGGTAAAPAVVSNKTSSATTNKETSISTPGKDTVIGVITDKNVPSGDAVPANSSFNNMA